MYWNTPPAWAWPPGSRPCSPSPASPARASPCSWPRRCCCWRPASRASAAGTGVAEHPSWAAPHRTACQRQVDWLLGTVVLGVSLSVVLVLHLRVGPTLVGTGLMGLLGLKLVVARRYRGRARPLLPPSGLRVAVVVPVHNEAPTS